MQIAIHPEAQAEVDAAMQWYENRRVGLGIEFNEAVDAALDRIEARPESGWKYGDRGPRVLPLKRFPYFVYYSADESVIRIHAVAHQRRRPDYWQHRKPQR